METNRFTPAGIAARYYYIQSKLGTYRSVTVAATYKFQRPSISPLSLQHVICQAVTSVLRIHPALSYGLIKPDIKLPPSFIRLEEIKLRDVVQFHDIKVDQELLSRYNGDSTEENLDSILAEQIGIEHAETWPASDRKPLWRCAVYNYEGTDSASSDPGSITTSRVDIVFVFHHGIADGLSGKIFQQALQVALKEAVSQPVSPENLETYIVPLNLNPPILVEDLMEINLDSTRASPQNDTTDYWTATNSALPTIDAYKSQVRLLSIPEINLKSILQYCRTEKITLTGLLHGLLTTSLARSIPTAQGFISCTPYSLRPFFKQTPSPVPNQASLIGCYIADTTATYPTDLLQRIRATAKGSPEEKAGILEIARKCRKEINEELERVGKGDVNVFANAARILAMGEEASEEIVKSRLGRKRGGTYELSNIGEFVGCPSCRDVDESGFRLEKLVFAQCGMVTGAALGCGVVSVRGGPFVASFTWMEGVLETEVVEGIVREVRERLMGL